VSRGAQISRNLSYVFIYVYDIFAGFSLEYTGLGTSETSLESDGEVTTATLLDVSVPLSMTTVVSQPLVAPVTLVLDPVTDQPT
jgi:hypothetical protein